MGLSYGLGLRLSYGLGQMATIEDIRQRLLAGEQPVDLVKAGFPKSSVYRVAKQVGAVRLPVESEEVAELRKRKQIMELEQEIQELEAEKGKLPERVAALEREVVWLHALIRRVGDSSIYWVLRSVSGERAMDVERTAVSTGWVQREIEPKVPQPIDKSPHSP